MKTTLCLLAVLLTLQLGANTCRVGKVNGVPQILQNGKVISDRILFVCKTAQENVTLKPEWQNFEMPFSVLKDCNDGAMHLRFFSMAFQKQPEKIVFANLEVFDVTAKKVVRKFDFNSKELDPGISFYCTGKRKGAIPATISNKEGQLQIVSPGDPKGLLGEFHLICKGIPVKRNHNYKVRFRARADREQNMTSSLYKQYPFPDPLVRAGTTFINQVKFAGEAGVDLVTFSMDTPWLEPGKKADYSELEYLCKLILKHNPKAKLIPRVDLRTPPEWWRKKYPDEMTKFVVGSNRNYPTPSSLQYRKDAGEALRGVIRFCEKNFPGNMAGYHPAGGNSNEWFYIGSQGRVLSGYDPATEKAWQRYLLELYPSDDALQKAWKKTGISRRSVKVPTPEYRKKVRKNTLLSPLDDKELIDFHFFLQKEMSDTILYLAKIIREETAGKRLSVLFYGYLAELSGIANGPACSGHYALRRVLNSPDVDIISGPISYHDRQVGGGTTTMTAADSITLAGKLWLNEDDTSTHVAYINGNRAPGWKNGATTPAESDLLLRRNLMVADFHNFSTWWMDLWGIGWFNDPGLWENMKKFAPLNAGLRQAKLRFQVADVIDETSLLYLAPAGFRINSNAAVSVPLVKFGRSARNRIGASVGQFMLDDMLEGKIDSDLFIVTSAWALTAEQRGKLRSIAAKKPVFWCYAPGWMDLPSGKVSPEFVEQTTGFKVKVVTGCNFTTLPTRDGIRWGMRPRSSVTSTVSAPVLSPIPQKGDIVLARYENDEPAILFRPGKVPALYCGTSHIPAELYRLFAKHAGVRLYTDRPAYVKTRGDFIGICAPEAGEYKVSLKSGIKSLNLQKGECVILEDKAAK